MLAIPVIEVSGARAIERGASVAEPSSLADARDVARRWAGYGFSRLHVVDLEAATDRGANTATVRALLDEAVAHTQVAGGLGTTDAVERYLDNGADWVVVGSRAVRDEDWLVELASHFPGGVIVALDVRDRRAVWSRTAGTERAMSNNVLDLVEDFERSGVALGGVLITSLDGVARASHGDLALLEDIAEASPWPVLVGGGVDSMATLRALAERGVAAALVRRALQSGALDPRVVADEFSE